MKRLYLGKIDRIITSNWPQEYKNFIPKPEYGNVDRIEYSEKGIDIYINNAKKNDVKDYLNKIKEFGFTENPEKSDGKTFLRYKVCDEKGNNVQITFYKENKILNFAKILSNGCRRIVVDGKFFF